MRVQKSRCASGQRGTSVMAARASSASPAPSRRSVKSMGVSMTEILFGGRESIERTPAVVSLINCNSQLRWDDRMLDAQFEYNRANQPVVLTPFLLMGAMSPVTIPAALTQQLAEALSGIALAQLIRPGCPVIFGSFLSNIDMQSGSPSFGTPESAIGLLCTGQLARHYGLFIPGNTNVVPKNMPGAGSLRAANYVYNLAARDPVDIALIAASTAVEPLSE